MGRTHLTFREHGQKTVEQISFQLFYPEELFAFKCTFTSVFTFPPLSTDPYFPSLCLNDLYLGVVICHLPARCLGAGGGGSGGSVENAGADLFNNDILKISSSFTIQNRISRNYFQVDIC